MRSLGLITVLSFRCFTKFEGSALLWPCQQSSPMPVTFCCFPCFTFAPCLASVLSFSHSHSFCRDLGLGFVQVVDRILHYGSPRKKGQFSQVENPEKLVSFSSWMKPIKVLSAWADGNRLDLLAWSWVRAKMLPLILVWEWQMESEQICCCLYPYARTSARCGVSTCPSPLRKSCLVALQSNTKSRGNLYPVVKAEDWKDTLCLLDCSIFLKEKNNFCFDNLLAYYLWEIQLWSLSFIPFLCYLLHCHHCKFLFYVVCLASSIQIVSVRGWKKRS